MAEAGPDPFRHPRPRQTRSAQRSENLNAEPPLILRRLRIGPRQQAALSRGSAARFAATW
ncbi:hypothetical protein GCM10010346_61040 [Streptomyces chryseus]|uniref:Uncharacterized protein n=1 Tax=Streptomyces chryseus TaxID=68186 RepID=A0ABQ3EBA5_9ACTN|nr:hypothetical protein GCM10010346_61040 [Streptomyces chryseus]